MEIKTKYNIGDKVCALNNNRIIWFTINAIEINIKASDPTVIVYTSKEEYEDYSFVTGCNVLSSYTYREENVFATKEELLKSL